MREICVGRAMNKIVGWVSGEGRVVSSDVVSAVLESSCGCPDETVVVVCSPLRVGDLGCWERLIGEVDMVGLFGSESRDCEAVLSCLSMKKKVLG